MRPPRLSSLVIVSILGSAIAACSPAATDSAVESPAPTETAEPTPTTDPTAEPSSEPTEPVPTTDPTAETKPDPNKKYTFVVSFYSPGNGTDGAAFDRLKAILAAMPSIPAAVQGRWGREGEHDECFDLSGVSAADKVAFIARVKKEVGNSDRVNLKDDATCSSR